MPKLKAKKVTLPPIMAARKMVDDRERRGLASATPERIVMAGDDLSAEPIDVRASANDARQRVNTDPLERLYRRGLLHPDPEMNEVLFMAANEYRAIWWGSGLGRSVGGINTSGVFSPATERNPGMAGSERQAHFRAKWRRAREEMGFHFHQAVDAIVLEGEEPDKVGLVISFRRDHKQARAIAMDRLAGGLRVLAHHFGFAKWKA